jgi:hypothetical protein
MAALFRFVKKKTGSIRTIPPLRVDGKLFFEDHDKADILNTVFVANCVVDNNIVPQVVGSHAGNRCECPTFPVKKVLDVLSFFKPSHSIGPDGYSAFFYKEIKEEVCEPLSRIFTLSMETGILPADWKKARISPIFKKGEASDPQNYRPIALTCVPCKIMERIIREKMLSFIQENNILADDQFGFVPGRSTCLLLLSVLDDWTCSLDEGIPLDAILIDFAKAFESVVHAKLLVKLNLLGFTGGLLDWLNDFLSKRTQCVSVGGACSEVKPVVSGVPQGSVLGPLLFILFLNDLTTTSTDTPLKKFADDVMSYAQVVDEVSYRALGSVASNLSNWSSAWQLPLAPLKCSVFHLGRHNTMHDYVLSSNSFLSHTKIVKDLGVWFTSDLKFATHCNHIVKSANQRVAMLKKLFTSGDVNTMVRAFKIFVRPILEYASPVWSPHLVGDIDRVESVQRRFTKSLRGQRKKSYSERLSFLELDSLELRRLKADLYLTFSLLHSLVDFNFAKLFELRIDNRTRGHPLKLSIGQFKTDCRKYFFANRIVKVWNDLPGEVVMLPTLNSFKSRLRQLDLTRYLSRPF